MWFETSVGRLAHLPFVSRQVFGPSHRCLPRALARVLRRPPVATFGTRRKQLNRLLRCCCSHSSFTRYCSRCVYSFINSRICHVSLSAIIGEARPPGAQPARPPPARPAPVCLPSPPLARPPGPVPARPPARPAAGSPAAGPLARQPAGQPQSASQAQPASKPASACQPSPS